MKMFKFFQFYNWKFYSYLNYGTLWDVSDMIKLDDFDGGGKPIDYNFEKMGWNTNSFFLNGSEVVILAIYLAFLVPIISMTSMICKWAFCKNVYANLRDGFIYNFFMLTFCRCLLNAFMNFRFFNYDTRAERLGSFSAYAYLIFTVTFLLFVYYNTFIFFYENRKRMNVEPISIRWNKEKPDVVLFEGGDDEKPTLDGKPESGKGTPLND